MRNIYCSTEEQEILSLTDQLNTERQMVYSQVNNMINYT